jgi:hypothetical protein
VPGGCAELRGAGKVAAYLAGFHLEVGGRCGSAGLRPQGGLDKGGLQSDTFQTIIYRRPLEVFNQLSSPCCKIPPGKPDFRVDVKDPFLIEQIMLWTVHDKSNLPHPGLY